MRPDRDERGPVARRKRAGEYHHGNLSQTLVAVATKLIESGEYGQLTLRAVAKAAGVSIAAPYRHFENREALLAATLAEGFRDLARRTDQDRLTAPNATEALIETGLAYVRFAAERPRLYRLMFGPECEKARFPDLMEASHAALGVLHQAVDACRKPLGFRKADVQPIALAGWSLTHGLASLYVDGLLAGTCTRTSLDATARTLVLMLIEGLRKRPAPRRAS